MVGEAAIDPCASAVLHRSFDQSYPVITAGSGSHLQDRSGRWYLDATGGGAAVANIGYGSARVADAAARQIAKLHYVHNVRYTTEEQEHLARRLADVAPGSLHRTFFVQGGSEANEAALRLVRKYHTDGGEPERDVIITQESSFHGATLGTLSLSGMRALHNTLEPWIQHVEYFAPYSCMRDADPNVVASALRDAIGMLDEIADRIGRHRIAAVFLDTVSIAAGLLIPPWDFFALVRTWCDETGALLIFDEVVTGMGRTGKWFSAEHWDVEPDAVTIAKGLGGGYTPIGALIVGERVYRRLSENSRSFVHGHSLNGNPVSCAIANVVLDVLQEERLIERSAQVGEQIKAELADRLDDVGVVGEVRGLGCLIAIEFFQDRASRAFLASDIHFSKRVADAALSNGLLVGAIPSSAAGYFGDCIILAPPLNISDADVEELLTKLELAIRTAAATLSTQPSPQGINISTGRGVPSRKPALTL